jgi:hypothetical protein
MVDGHCENGEHAKHERRLKGDRAEMINTISCMG